MDRPARYVVGGRQRNAPKGGTTVKNQAARKKVAEPDPVRIRVEASYPSPGRLNIVFDPPLQSWRFPSHKREQEGLAVALGACRDAVRRQSRGRDSDAPTAQIESAVEEALATLIENGTITVR